MRFWSVAIEVGTAGIRATSSDQVVFHYAVAQLFTTDPRVERLGATNWLTVTHHEAVHDTAVLRQRLIAALTTQQQLDPTIADLFILDFSGNPFFVLREPLLYMLAVSVADACAAELACKFAILLPKLPWANGAFRRKLEHLAKVVPTAQYEITIIVADGSAVKYSRAGESAQGLGKKYRPALTALYGDDSSRLERKCVRRLGHFPAHRTDIRKDKCRHYSYYLHDCGPELTRLFRNWWIDNRLSHGPILYDLRGNDLLREVVIAHGERHGVKVERIVDVLDDPQLASEVCAGPAPVLVLDVVDTGLTLRRHVHELTLRGINVSAHVLVGVNKGGARDSQFQDPNVSVHGLLARSQEVIPWSCPQCALRLPYTSDVGEELIRLRSYDVMFMITRAGWTTEPASEVPDNIGKPYEVVPNFATMLEEFGDWIAFKLYNAVRDRGLPEDWFVIHPEEGDSSALSQKLYDCVPDELPIVRVPRDYIKQAQSNGGDWSALVGDASREDWIDQLRSLGRASALILDIFNASGATAAALIKAVRHFQIMPISYACVVDFAPNSTILTENVSPKISLYEWDAPRTLNPKS